MLVRSESRTHDLPRLSPVHNQVSHRCAGWQDWGFSELLQALEEWKEIHPLETNHKNLPSQPRVTRIKSFHACVYCDCVTHRSWECNRITLPADHRRVLKNKHLCFDCTGPQHNASQCRSRVTCLHCKQRDKAEGRDQHTHSEGVALTASLNGEKVCHPIVLVSVNGVTCRALLDTGTTVSYASGYILDPLKLAPSRSLMRRIQTIVGVATKRNEVYYPLKTQITRN